VGARERRAAGGGAVERTVVVVVIRLGAVAVAIFVWADVVVP
jgi:hypothetical protein